MTDGGSIAIDRFRYQDLCAIYFALESYIQSPTVFEQLYCEQDKLDFEVWNNNGFNGYQVKNVKGSLAASELNQILTYYLRRASTSGKSDTAFWFILSEKPKHSLYYLLLKLNGNTGVNYQKRTKEYLRSSLNGITTTNFKIDYRCYNLTEIENLAFAVSRKVLKQNLGDTDDIPTEVVTDFICRFRDEIDIVSSDTDSVKRVYKIESVNKLIKTFLSRTKIIKLEDEGTRKKVITGKPLTRLAPIVTVPTKTPSAFASVEGEVIKNI